MATRSSEGMMYSEWRLHISRSTGVGAWSMLVGNKILARSASSDDKVEPTRRMSIASCFDESRRLFWMVRAADLAPSMIFDPALAPIDPMAPVPA